MSLINQMLQDLEARRATGGPNSGLPNEVRPLPAAPPSRAPLIVGAGALVIALAGGFAWRMGYVPVAEGSPAAPVVMPPALPPAVAAPGLPPSPAAAMPAGNVPASSIASAEDDDGGLRLTTSLRFLPERTPLPVSRTSTPASSRTTGSPTVAAAAKSAPAATATATAAAAPHELKATGPVSIEKSAASGSPQERAEGEYRKALASLNAGRSSEALEGLRAALRQDGTHIASRQLLFKLLVENKHLDDAAELLQDGLQAQPGQISWAMSLGRLQVDRGDLPGAWKTLQRSLPAAGGSADYQGFAAHVLQRLGRSKEAAEYYQTATRLMPAEGRWWLGLGLALEADGRVAEAREALLRAKASGTLSQELSTFVDQKLRQLS